MNAIAMPIQRRTVRLWLPVLLPAVLVLPLLPIAALALIPGSPRPFAAVWMAWRVLLACAGTTVEVDAPHARVSIRLF
ncbi:hypothetical protein QO010_000326 [Caulobacter ginsengisoli]|uniref:Uncharacterized protein n=1 Tax=Caulobacter ginsengisoli TaxID=400775 RepID=A0ABU0IKP5_9CAUL|nr:hypothetical protein [Caulobacter ginsengisoli]MDQ0462578.1 hypothetical protein [Caulobacter ginsengisoli]